MHFTPTGSSWINQVERWFGHLTAEDPPRRPQKHPSPGSRHPLLDRRLEPRPTAVHLDQDRRRDPRITRAIFVGEFPAQDTSASSLNVDRVIRRF
nr:hypothetical protein [Micromonospora phytophila]